MIITFTVTYDECALEKDPGPCSGSVLRWYYDTNRGSCRKFVYGGCKGNGNKFRTEIACKQRCNIRGIPAKIKVEKEKSKFAGGDGKILLTFVDISFLSFFVYT